MLVGTWRGGGSDGTGTTVVPTRPGSDGTELRWFRLGLVPTEPELVPKFRLVPTEVPTEPELDFTCVTKVLPLVPIPIDPLALVPRDRRYPLVTRLGYPQGCLEVPQVVPPGWQEQSRFQTRAPAG